MKRYPRMGFTLTEIIIVVAIIAALTALAFPISRSVVAKSRQTACLSNLRQIGVGLEGYLQDHAQRMPEISAGRKTRSDDAPVLEVILADYLSDSEVFHCPADHSEFARSGCSYIWNASQSGRHRLDLQFFGKSGDDQRIPLVIDKEDWHPGESSVNFLYADLSASSKVQFDVSR